MRLTDLETFLLVAEGDNFTTTAQAMFVSQSTVSARIKTLERHYGVILVERSSHENVLTDAGKSLKQYAERILRMEMEARDDIMGMSDNVRHILRIGSSPSSSSCVVPLLLKHYNATGKNIEYKIEVDEVPLLMARLCQGEIDVAIIEPCFQSKSVTFHDLCEDRIVFVAGANTVFAKMSEPISPDVIVTLPFVRRRSQHCTYTCIRQLFLKDQIAEGKMEPVLRTNDLDSLKTAVKMGIGIAAISEWAVIDEVRAGVLVVLPVKGVKAVRRRVVATCSRVNFAQYQQDFLSFVTSVEVRDLLAQFPR